MKKITKLMALDVAVGDSTKRVLISGDTGVGSVRGEAIKALRRQHDVKHIRTGGFQIVKFIGSRFSNELSKYEQELMKTDEQTRKLENG